MLLLIIKILTRQTGVLLIQVILCFIILFHPLFRTSNQSAEFGAVMDKISLVEFSGAESESTLEAIFDKLVMAKSSYFKERVGQLIHSHLGHTVALFSYTIICSIIIVLGLSILVIQQVRWAVKILDNLGRIIEALPIFILSILIIMFINLGIFHYESVQHNFPKINFFVSFAVLSLEYILFLYLSTSQYYEYIRRQKYILNIRSKGKRPLELGLSIILKQVLVRIFNLPSKLGLVLISLLFIEYLFHDRGLGHLFFQAFYHRDYNLIFGLLVVLLTLLALLKLVFKILIVILSARELQLKS